MKFEFLMNEKPVNDFTWPYRVQVVLGTGQAIS